MSRQRLACVFASTLFTLPTLAGCENPYPPRPQTWADAALPEHTPATSLPPASAEGVGPEGSLLAVHAKREPRTDEELSTWKLHYQSKTMVVEFLIAAGKDDPARLETLLADNARWGVPDRRELRARPIMTKADPLGLEFLDAFRGAASRFAAKASFTCTPLQPGWQMLVSAGAEPVWCSYTSKDGLDIIAFRLIIEQGRVVTDYVGFFKQRQTAAIRIDLSVYGDPPNLTPYIKRPVSLTAPELMPDGSNPALEGQPPPRRRPTGRPMGRPTAQPQPVPVPAPTADGSPITVNGKAPAKPPSE